MAAGRKYIGFNVDTSAGDALIGFMEQISVSMNTPAHIGPVLKLAHAEMSNEFTMHMSTLAPADPSRFHHVYEWNRIGDPRSKLWTDVLKGGGNNRFATFEWRASRTTVPVVDDLPPVLNKNGSPTGGGSRPKQIHVFVWKAPVMEYGEDVEIAPKRGKYIAYFTGPWSSNPELYQELHFSTQPITVHNPGGERVKGAFTAEYVEWWSGAGAASVFKERLNRIFSMNTKKMIETGLSTLPRKRGRTFTMQTVGDRDAAIAAGKEAAMAAMARLENNYIEAARAREAFLQ